MSIIKVEILFVMILTNSIRLRKFSGNFILLIRSLIKKILKLRKLKSLLNKKRKYLRNKKKKVIFNKVRKNQIQKLAPCLPKFQEKMTHLLAFQQKFSRFQKKLNLNQKRLNLYQKQTRILRIQNKSRQKLQRKDRLIISHQIDFLGFD